MEYHTKTITWNNDPTRFAIMMTAFDGAEMETFSQEGYRGWYVMFTKMSGPIVESHYDPRKMNCTNGDDDLLQFLLDVRAGWCHNKPTQIPWERIEDGMEVTPEKTDQIRLDRL